MFLNPFPHLNASGEAVALRWTPSCPARASGPASGSRLPHGSAARPRALYQGAATWAAGRRRGRGPLPQPAPRPPLSALSLRSRASLASQNGPSSGNGAAAARASPLRERVSPRPNPRGASNPSRPRSTPQTRSCSAVACPTSKETRPKGSPSAAMSKNTVGLTMVDSKRPQGEDSGVCKAARTRTPASFITIPSSAYSPVSRLSFAQSRA